MSRVTVDYAQTPPAGGDHNAVWLNCGIYDQPVPNVNAVHSLEHGAVWVTYDAARRQRRRSSPPLARAAAVDATSSSRPYEGLDSPIVMSAWNAQLKLDSADDPRDRPSSSRRTGATRTPPSRTRPAPARSTRPGKQ